MRFAVLILGRLTTTVDDNRGYIDDNRPDESSPTFSNRVSNNGDLTSDDSSPNGRRPRWQLASVWALTAWHGQGLLDSWRSEEPSSPAHSAMNCAALTPLEMKSRCWSDSDCSGSHGVHNPIFASSRGVSLDAHAVQGSLAAQGCEGLGLLIRPSMAGKAGGASRHTTLDYQEPPTWRQYPADLVQTRRDILPVVNRFQ
jgi:hypothetical protein